MKHETRNIIGDFAKILTYIKKKLATPFGAANL